VFLSDFHNTKQFDHKNIKGGDVMKKSVLCMCLVAVICSTLFCLGCDSSSNSSSSSNYYPAMKELGFEDRDIQRLEADSNRKVIDADSIKSFPLGTAVNTINSTYLPYPVFDMALVNKENLIRLVTQGSKDDGSIVLTSNKAAATESWAMSTDANGGFNVMGVFGASAAAHYDMANSKGSSDGSVYVSICKGTSNVFYEVITGDLETGFNLTPYLIGEALDEEEIDQYVSYTTKQLADGRTYIDSVTFSGQGGYGLIDWANRQYYANVQLITEMEAIFGMLKMQFYTFEGRQDIQATLLSLMQTVKEKIGHAVMDFKAHVGTHFVSSLKLGNYAYGYGMLKFNETYGTEEIRFGASASVSGGIPSKLNVQAGMSVGFARQNGWASAMKGLEVNTAAYPKGVAGDMLTFEQSIKTMLDNESQPLTVPDPRIPELPKVEVKEPEKPEKKSVGPPDSVFASYKEWKEYQEDLKKENEVEKEQEETIDWFEDDILDEDEQISSSNPSYQQTLHENFMWELWSLKSGGASGDDTPTTDIIRIDDMFAYRFEITPYDAVIPALRTMKISLPEQSGGLQSYPFATKLLARAQYWRKAVEYFNFISQFSVTNISGTFRDNFNTFYKHYNDTANLTITSALAAGHDVDEDNYNGFLDSMYRSEDVTKSQLYNDLKGDIDHLNFVKYLLRSPQYRLWADAPGGYAPFMFDHSGNTCFARLESMVVKNPMAAHEAGNLDSGAGSSGDGEEPGEANMDPNDCLYRYGSMLTPYETIMNFNLSYKLKDTPDDVSVLYEGLAQSPLYPVFRYQQKNDPKLLFMQFVGKYQFLYGKNGLIHPFFCDAQLADLSKGEPRSVKLNQESFSAPCQDINVTIINELIDKIQGFDPEKDFGNDHALYFPDKTQSQALWKKYRLLLLPNIKVSYSFDPSKTRILIKDPGKDFMHECDDSGCPCYAYACTDFSTTIGDHYTANIGNVVKVEEGTLSSIAGFRMLMPIDYTKIGQENGQPYGTLIMGSSYGVDDLISSSTMAEALINAMQDYTKPVSND
jgi:hypothetical protein